TGSQAEELRRAMGFKRPDRRMEQIEANLRAGMNRNNIDEATQNTIVTCVKAFANYGFPESHAYSFALLAYASAYFMVHYRACFMTAMFNNYPLGFYSAATLVKDAQRHGLHFLPIDINRSDYLFTVEDVRTGGGSDRGLVSTACGSGRVTTEKQVRVGLKYVRGLREEIGQKIVAERLSSPPGLGGVPEALRRRGGSSEESDFCRTTTPSAEAAATPPKPGGELRSSAFPYTSVEDLIRRVPEINKREIRALSLAGALNFDGTVHRREALWQSELAIQPAGPLFENAELSNAELSNAECGMRNAESVDSTSEDVSQARQDDKTNSAFRTPHSALKPDSAFLARMEGLELVDADLRKTGISIGKHPMAFVRDDMTELGILSAHQSRNLRRGQVVSVAGAVIIRQRPMTANNVVFITIEDETGFANFIVMPDMYERFRSVINQSNFLIIRGVFEERGMIKAISFKPLDELKSNVVSHDFR
ncbi:MAG TPA: hypothetical protein VMZ26_04600, partial [Pyrinomonadaceae bacterium]|nr:hypothetical protein [Pyrinomonadaceae bacterium]